MARVWKPHCAERFFVGGLKKGAREEWMASHIRVTAAPSFCERRLGKYRRTKSEMSRGCLQITRTLQSAFVEYAGRVPVFFPRLSLAGAASGHFSWDIYRRNREYEAAIGLAVVMALLWVLMLWRSHHY
jgi:hypothetical protein